MSVPETRRAHVRLGVLATVLVLLALAPLALAPRLDVSVEAPSLVPAGSAWTISGEVTSFGLGKAGVDIILLVDGRETARTQTDASGAFVATFRWDTNGPRTVEVQAAPGTRSEASMDFVARAVDPPTSPRIVSAATASGFGWSVDSPPTAPVQELRIYRQETGAPWMRVATLAPGETEWQDAHAPANTRYAVAAANVAGESAWAVTAAS